MQTLLIEAKYTGDIKLSDAVLNGLKDCKTVGLFCSVQFSELDTVKKQLEEAGIEWKITKAARTNVEGQILGCDAYHNSFRDPIIDQCDALLYVGDGYFHPKALLIAQIYSHKAIKPVHIWNPILQKYEIIDEKAIIKQIKKTKANLTRFVAAKTIGILVTVKPGQQYLKNAEKLKKQLEEQGKKAYIFVDDDVQIFLLENFPFVDSWVNTACPRIGTDDITTISQPMVNIREAWDPIQALHDLYPLK